MNMGSTGISQYNIGISHVPTDDTFVLIIYMYALILFKLFAGIADSNIYPQIRHINRK